MRPDTGDGALLRIRSDRCDAGPMLLRMLRGPEAGRPGPLARMVAFLVVLGLVAVSAPPLVAVVRWVFSLL